MQHDDDDPRLPAGRALRVHTTAVARASASRQKRAKRACRCSDQRSSSSVKYTHLGACTCAACTVPTSSRRCSNCVSFFGWWTCCKAGHRTRSSVSRTTCSTSAAADQLTYMGGGCGCCAATDSSSQPSCSARAAEVVWLARKQTSVPSSKTGGARGRYAARRLRQRPLQAARWEHGEAARVNVIVAWPFQSSNYETSQGALYPPAAGPGARRRPRAVCAPDFNGELSSFLLY